MRLFNFLKRKSLKDSLSETKKVKVEGVLFTIKKINPMDFLDGSKVMLQVYDTYKLDKNKASNEANFKKIKSHYRDVILAGVIKPELSRKVDPVKIHIEELFSNWAMVDEVYNEIMNFTYGKKKLLKVSQKLSLLT